MEILLENARITAATVVKHLEPYCTRIEVAGSIRRRRPVCHDVDIVLIIKPEALLTIDLAIAQMGQITKKGPWIQRVTLRTLQEVDLYFATEESFGTLMLIRTGSEQNNIRLAKAALAKGWHLKASGEGLLDGDGLIIAQDERSIYERLGERYQQPWERN